MKKKEKKNILANCIKAFYNVGFIMNIGLIVGAIIIFSVVLFADKTNIIKYYETIITSSTLAQSLTNVLYLVIAYINIMISFVLLIISTILGIIGYRLGNKILKMLGFSINAVAVFITLPFIECFSIFTIFPLSCFRIALYFEKELEKKKKKTINK